MNLPIQLGAQSGTPLLLHAPASVSEGLGLSVLVVDDEAGMREEMSGLLRRRGLNVLTAASAEAAAAVLAGRPDIGVLVADIRLSGRDGIELAEQSLFGRGEARALEVILITGHVSPRHGMATLRLSAFGLLQKPFAMVDFAAVVADALDSARARRGRALLGQAGPRPRPTPAGAAEALLQTLAQRLEGDGGTLETIGRELRDPLAGILAHASRLDAGGRLDAGSACGIRGEALRLLEMLDELLEVAALEGGSLSPRLEPVTVHGLAGALVARLGTLGLGCRRRITLQPDADLAFLVDLPRLCRAAALLAGQAAQWTPGGRDTLGPVELACDAGAGEARIELTFRPAAPPETEEEPRPEALALAIARRLVAVQDGRLEAWRMPRGGLRARMILRSA